MEDIENEKYRRDAIDLLSHYLYGYYYSVFDLLLKLKSESSLIFPLCFLVSHYMELWTKSLGYYFGMDDGYDFAGLGITGHNVRKLLTNNDQMSEFKESGISASEIRNLLGYWEYFEGFSQDNVDLSISMRYPVLPKNNQPTISQKLIEGYEKTDFDEFIDKAALLLNQADNIFQRFIEKQLELFQKVDPSPTS